MKNKANVKYKPTKGYPYFYFDREGDEFVYFATAKDRDEAVNSAIQGFLDDGWNEEVDGVIVGKITGKATRVNIELPPEELDEDSRGPDGEYWDQDWNYKCDYKIKPLGFVCPSVKESGK